MSKVKWLSADLDVSARQLARLLQQAQFTKDSEEGFVVDRARRNSIEARYVQRVNVTEVIVDPFGNEAEFSSVKYSEQHFFIADDLPCIELRQGVRHLHACLALLSQTTDFRIAVTPVKVDVNHWLEVFAASTSMPFTVDAFQVGSIAFSDGASARALVKAGRGDAQTALKSLTSARPYVIEKVRVKHQRVDHRGTVVLASSGTASTTGFSIEEDTHVLEALRNSLSVSI